MIRVAAMPVTTRHSASAYPWQCQAGLPAIGPIVGRDLLTDSMFCYDAFSLYEAGIVSSPNMVVIGLLGHGKSAFVKTYLARCFLLGRKIFVLDPKGEYSKLAEYLGIPVLSLHPGGNATLNPLDPGPGGGGDRIDLARRRCELLAGLAQVGLSRPVTSAERSAIAAATSVLSVASTAPTLADVVGLLFRPTEEMAAALATSPEALAGEARPAALELQRMVAGDLRGMFDGQTTVGIDWEATSGLVIDLSRVFSTVALAPVMLCAGTWLSAAIAKGGFKSHLVVDECWSVIHVGGIVGWLQAVSKLARQYGVQLVTVMHRLSDLRSQVNADTAAYRQAQGLLSDAQTRVVYRQAESESSDAAALLGLTSAEERLITRLAKGKALWHVGSHVGLVEHIMTARELSYAYTDEAMV